MNILKSSSIAAVLLFSLSLMAGAQTTAKTEDGKEVIILDADGDGWDDLWCAIYPEIAHDDRTKDSDGDGITDYDEMLLWKNCSWPRDRANQPPRRRRKPPRKRLAARRQNPMRARWRRSARFSRKG